jgi:ABC-type amino acid transport system permease subunit
MSHEEEGPNPIALVHRWRAALDTQMHFNDMLIRTRAAGLSIVIAVFGGAALAVEQFPQHLALFPGVSVHLAAIVMFFGLLLLFSIFVLDYFYYYRMLLAAVERSEQIEAESQRPGEPIAFDLTGPISRRVSRTRATLVLWVFYGAPFLCGIVFMIFLAMLPPPTP